MTDKPKPPETPGMAEVSAKFVDEAEAAARNVQDAIKAVLDKIPPRGDGETQIAHTYRKLLMMRAGQPRGLSDDDLAVWVDEHDRMEEVIGRLEARSTQDVDIKLSVLCDRLRETETGGLLLAQTARDDLKKVLMIPSPARQASPLIEQSLDNAVTDLESALTDLDSARQSLGGFLEDHMQDHPRMETAYCILKTLDQAEHQGRAAWKVLWEARPLKAGRAES